MSKKQIVLFLLVCCHAFCFCQIKLPRLIGNGMVLQRDKPIKLWGWAAANEGISLQFNHKIFKTTADTAGRWWLALPAQAGGGPYTLAFSASNTVAVEDVWFGDVWICSGQSNMEITMERVQDKYPEEIAQANYPQIRQFVVPDRYNFNQAEEDLASGQWRPATPPHLLSFSAVAYFFAKDLFDRYRQPIGLINSALGGSPIEAWLSEDALKKFPTDYQEAQKFKNPALIAKIENEQQIAGNKWRERLYQLDEGLKKGWSNPDLDDSAWQEMTLPGYWADAGLGQINGSVWFRKIFDLPADIANAPGKLLLGRVVDADSVFLNGTFVGATTYQYPPRRYLLPPGILKPGKNTLVVRVINQAGKGGFVPDKPYQLAVGNRVFDLKGPWKGRVGATLEALPSPIFVRWKPLGLYNAMIAPLLPYPITGVIWYQGESNTKQPAGYADRMQALIADWRKHWNQGDFPFLYVQLANFMETQTVPSESNWAALREAQRQTLAVPNTGMAVAIDAGEWNDIHPLDKKSVGQRLALQARRLAYGETKIVHSGPLFRSARKRGDKIILKFEHAGSGLTALGGKELRYFSIAAAGHPFLWAKARIKGKRVIVWHEAVQHPVAVRYAWADNPEGANLYNKAGLPASPFEATVKVMMNDE